MKPRTEEKKKPTSSRTNVPGQNPQQNDSPDKDVHHDENREDKIDKQAEQTRRTPRGENL